MSVPCFLFLYMTGIAVNRLVYLHVHTVIYDVYKDTITILVKVQMIIYEYM